MNVPIEEPSRRASWMPKRDHGSLLGHVLGFPSLTKIRWGCKPQACCSYNRQHVGHVTARSYIWDCIAILNLRKNESVTPSRALRQRAMICIWVQSWYACFWADVCPLRWKYEYNCRHTATHGIRKIWMKSTLFLTYVLVLWRYLLPSPGGHFDNAMIISEDT